MQESKINNPLLEQIPFDPPIKNEANLIISQPKKAWWYSRVALLCIVIALLFFIMLLLFAWRPTTGLVVGKKSAVNSLEIEQKGKKHGQLEKSPWQSAQKQQDRSKAQAVLTQLLKLKQQLDDKNISIWGENQFQSALDAAKEGDDYYNNAKFFLAAEQYQQAVTSLQGLLSYLPNKITQDTLKADKALQNKNTKRAKTLYQTILAIEPDNQLAEAGLKRADSLPIILEKNAQADALLEKSFEFNPSQSNARQKSDILTALHSAKKLLLQAQEIDSELSFVNTRLAEIQAILIEQEYQNAMSKGLLALKKNRYSLARNAFSNALKLRINDPVATALYQQTSANQNSAGVQNLVERAQQYEKQEDWAKAVTAYDAILSKDPSQIVAKLGNIRSKAMLTLVESMDELLADPLLLSHRQQFNQAQSVLKSAKNVNQKGALLQKKISDLETHLLQSQQAVFLTLISDENTQVELIKRGSKKVILGKFSSKKISLKPGRYIVKGFRNQYKDVRLELAIKPNKKSQRIFTIQCTQKIN